MTSKEVQKSKPVLLDWKSQQIWICFSKQKKKLLWNSKTYFEKVFFSLKKCTISSPSPSDLKGLAWSDMASSYLFLRENSIIGSNESPVTKRMLKKWFDWWWFLTHIFGHVVVIEKSLQQRNLANNLFVTSCQTIFV